ncbi:MAG: XkdF-like putative serine protease domain-containing protein [Dehalococcoidia bacterium]|nr:XkdF-like putative serine protease domain-containing protein [Dehalococcoidia bacterium]
MRKVNGEDPFIKAEVVKIDAELGLVFGWGIVCKVDGEPYFDSQRDHIPEASMLRATADFMEKSRMSSEMHARDDDGVPMGDGAVIFSFPLTTEVAKALEIDTRKTGWLVAIKPSPGVLAKFKSGEYAGFSIGGGRLVDEDVV